MHVYVCLKVFSFNYKNWFRPSGAGTCVQICTSQLRNTIRWRLAAKIFTNPSCANQTCTTQRFEGYWSNILMLLLPTDILYIYVYYKTFPVIYFITFFMHPLRKQYMQVLMYIYTCYAKIYILLLS